VLVFIVNNVCLVFVDPGYAMSPVCVLWLWCDGSDRSVGSVAETSLLCVTSRKELLVYAHSLHAPPLPPPLPPYPPFYPPCLSMPALCRCRFYGTTSCTFTTAAAAGKSRSCMHASTLRKSSKLMGLFDTVARYSCYSAVLCCLLCDCATLCVRCNPGIVL
jgi:hypothetical protein